MISTLIPAYNEAARIEATVRAVRALSLDGEIIVVDDGSTDDTAARAETAGADIVLRQANAGKGAALRAAFDISSGDTILMLDADLAESATEAAKLLDPIFCAVADMTIANFTRTSGKGGGMGLAVRLARWGIERLTGRRMQTPLSGQRAVRREVIACVGGFAPGWGAEVGLTIDALRLGYRVREVDTAMTHRVTGRTLAAILHRARQFMAVLRVLIRAFRHPTRCGELPPAAGNAGGQGHG